MERRTVGVLAVEAVMVVESGQCADPNAMSAAAAVAAIAVASAARKELQPASALPPARKAELVDKAVELASQLAPDPDFEDSICHGRLLPASAVKPLAERQELARRMLTVGLVPTAAHKPPAPLVRTGPPAPGHPILGTWRVYIPGTSCTETWEFRADGTTHDFSGAEEATSEYQISDKPTPEGYYVLVDTITSDNGGEDCTGQKGTPVGDRSQVYLQVLPDDRFKLCMNDALTFCIGEMVRAAKPGS